MQNPTLELSKEEMRKIGYQTIDTLVEHFSTISEQSPVKNAARRSMDWLLNETIPEHGTPAEEVLQHVQENILSNVALTTHPRFYSFVPSPNNYMSVIADTLASGFNVFSGAWTPFPAAAELEVMTINWLLKLFGFPVREGGGIFVSGGSMANVIGLSLARGMKIKPSEKLEDARVYYSDQTHSSVDRALLLLGFKKEQIRKIPSDQQFKLPLEALRKAVEEDKQAGKNPICVVGNAGTTNTGSIDSLPELSLFCRQEDLWLHVDAAYGGGAILCGQGQEALAGIEMADSITVDPHKWLYQPYEIGCILVRNHEWLSQTYRMNPEYLQDVAGNAEEVNFYDYGVQLTRRFRALKLYMSLKTFGLESFREAVKLNFKLAKETQKILEDSPHWEIISPAQLAVINFRYRPHHSTSIEFSEERLNELNHSISAQITENEEAMLVTTTLNNKTVLRMCLINPRTTLDDIRDTLAQLEGYAQEFLDSN